MPEEPSSDESTEVQERSRINRRRLLGVLGGTAGATLSTGFIKRVSAKSVNTRGVRNSAPVKALLHEVGDPEITGIQVKIFEGNGLRARIIELETEIGTLSHSQALASNNGKVDRGDTSVEFKIENLSRTTRAELSNRFRGTPLGVDLSIKHKSGEIVYGSSVTTEEKDQLARLVDAKAFTAMYVDAGDTYYHVQLPEGGAYRITGRIDRPQINNPSVEPLISARIDVEACFECGTEAPQCAALCFFSCAPPFGGPLGCAACIVQNCRDVDYVACAECIVSCVCD